MGRSWRVWTILTLALTVAGAGSLAVRRAVYAARLPRLPGLSGRPAAVREHLTEADRAARAHPTSVEAVGALGLTYHADLFYDEARRAYAVAEQLSGSAWRWTYLRSLAQAGLGDGGGSLAALRRVVDRAPDFGPAWWRLGEAEFKVGQNDRAEEAWRRALALPDPPRPASTGSPAPAASAPISAYAALGLARVALARGDADRARDLLETVTAKTPGFGPAFRLLGTAYIALGRTDDAERAARRADRSPAYEPYVDPIADELVRTSRSSTFLLQQAAAADLSANASWREYLIRRAVELEPENTDALYDLASILRALHRYEEALPLLERYRRLVPGDFQALADIGRCLSGLQRFGEAETLLRRALEGSDDANAHYDLAFVLDHTGRLSEAVAEYERALDRNPNHKDALNNLAVDLVRQGKMIEAEGRFEQLLATDPDNADAHTNLGAVFLTLGARDRAIHQFEEALRVNPNHALAREGKQKAERFLGSTR